VCLARIFVLSLLAVACGGSSRNDVEDDLPAPGGGRRGGTDDTGGRGAVAGGPNGGAAAAGSPTSSGSAGRAASGSAGAGGSANPDARGVELGGTPFYTRVQRLTNRQWERAVTDILRFGTSREISAAFARPVAGVTDFDNNERVVFVDATSFLDLESGAEAAAEIATGSPDALAAVYDGSDSAGFVRSVGRRAFRRPLTAAEEERYQAMFARGEELYGAGFANGAALVIRALLQSPHFLYRTELGPGGEPLSSYEAASKLSFWLLGTTPSDALLDAADAGELDSVDRLESVARQMLEEPGALEVMRDFHGQLLRLGLYQTVAKPGVSDFNPAINSELEHASYGFFDRIFREDLGLRQVFTSTRAFVGPGLAPYYDMDPLAELELRELDSERSGYFTHVPFLMLWGVDAASDPEARGLELQRMLCDTRPPALPLGAALEGFDGLGRERDMKVQTGSYAFAEGDRSFAGANELMDILADSAQAHTCYSKNVTAYALRRDLVEGDRPLLESLSQVSLARSLKETIIALVRDPAFRERTEAVQ
jgi:hypothetical protein